MTDIKNMQRGLGEFPFVTDWELRVDKDEVVLQVNLIDYVDMLDMRNLINYLVDVFGDYQIAGHVGDGYILIKINTLGG